MNCFYHLSQLWVGVSIPKCEQELQEFPLLMARVTGVFAHHDGSFFRKRLFHSGLLISCAPARLPGYVIKARHALTFRRAIVSPVHEPHQSLSSCLRAFPSQFSTRTKSWESRPPEPPFVKRHLLGCAGD